jgi:hypothetical protein
MNPPEFGTTDHEIGHIVAGHCEWTDAAIFERGNLPFRRILECDADAFAWHVSSWLQIQDGMIKTIHSFAPNVPWNPVEFSLILYFTAIGVLFRILYEEKAVDVVHEELSHPHPAVRSFLVCSYTFAKVAASGATTVLSLWECVSASIRNIEVVWADLLLPGQFPKPPVVWAAEIAEQARSMFAEYRKHDRELEQRSRLARHWCAAMPATFD